MQFLVYLTVLMVSVSTVLLEIHWLTTPAPQPKPAIQASTAPSRPRVEGPNAELSPIYPRRVDQTQPAPAQPSNESAPARSSTASAPAPSSSASANASAEVTQKPAAETTGASTHIDDTSKPASVAAVPTRTVQEAQASAPDPKRQQASVAPPKPDESAKASNNRCDVQACASAYRSFRAADCTYQPFDGPRRVCEKPPEQRAERQQGDEPQRRAFNRSDETRDADRRTQWRVYEEDDDDDGPDDVLFFRRSRRW